MGFESVPAVYIGGLSFITVILVAGYFSPGYSHARQSISELGESKAIYGRFVRWLGFVPLGLSFMIFAGQAKNLFSSSIPSVFIILIGVSILFAGIFPTDPDNRRDTASGKIHASAVIMLMLLLSTTPFMFSISAVYRNPPTGGFLPFSFLTGVLMLVFLLLPYTPLGNYGKNRQPKLGLQQRLQLALSYVWWYVFIQAF